MISLRKIFRKLRLKARPDTAAEAEEEPIASPLFRLPPEIILLIANMLPTPSIACLALSSRRACKENRVSNLVRSRLDPRTAPWARGKRLEQTLQCSYCYMDFVFGVLDFGERGLAVVVTKWVNLGAGLDIEDAKWKSHLINHADRPVHHLQHSGDIRKAFEVSKMHRSCEYAPVGLTAEISLYTTVSTTKPFGELAILLDW
ncbi:predicted protein [Sclerotinia sclerotiorum 1980 UF-70]|uniref:F-box domain-containing protein n=1 Tax=Sclerotinia sclerotiorum (strain ATCC 18683 / 1980 / Ss-1) TaxID=665079 RepID=A7EQ01_SCLS1|nr:predicted protein [Sclerotinia sclerotiorum 1980 UF-70]EDO04917.1 predicted protein [Sclerotinia sclerotiorum 1980 UF-70]